jgi:hypothetical protein
MRKYSIRINGKFQTIIAENKDSALKQAKVNLGYDENAILMNWTREWFYDISNLIERCENTKKHFGEKAIEIVESWEPLEIKDDCGHIEILRTDGYFDSIHFEPNQIKLFNETYNALKKYNREITPLEKYHASF